MDAGTRAAGIGILLGGLLAGSCTSYKDYRFAPTPQDHELLIEGQAGVAARVQVASLGLSKGAGGYAARFRLRVENPLAEPIRLAPGPMQLVDGSLGLFGAPEVVPAPPATGLEIAPLATAIFDLSFPFPGGMGPSDLDLSGLSLRWGIETPSGLLVASANFTQVWYGYYGPYYPYPYYGCYGAYGYWGYGWY